MFSASEWGKRMRVVAEEPWSWFLFEDDGKLFLDVLVENGAISFAATAEFNPEQAARYAREGIGYLNDLSSEMRHKALMRQWSEPPLPPDWAQRSVAAVHEWRKRRGG
jgi:hypothetical protein